MVLKETKIFLIGMNAISSCQSLNQVNFMIRWVSIAENKGYITYDKYLKILYNLINFRRKQLIK
ncbi:MAG: hypothetical protein ACOCV1_06895 [Bacillota bacterium]